MNINMILMANSCGSDLENNIGKNINNFIHKY